MMNRGLELLIAAMHLNSMNLTKKILNSFLLELAWLGLGLPQHISIS